jgi:hypothetical protein
MDQRPKNHQEEFTAITDVPFVNVSNAGDNFFPISYNWLICSLDAVELLRLTFNLNPWAPGLVSVDKPVKP